MEGDRHPPGTDLAVRRRPTSREAQAPPRPAAVRATPQATRRVTLPPGLGDRIRDRATANGRDLSEEVIALINYALAEERKPTPPPDSPLERRIRHLLREDPNLTRAAATSIAKAGGHDR